MRSAATVDTAALPLAEWAGISVLLMAAMVGWVMMQGGGALTWDAFNHHIYLGRQALEGSRLLWDYFAAGEMSCQYPQGYAPLVAMLDAGWSGTAVFAVLTLLAALSVPACWLITWSLLPSRSNSAMGLRLAGTVLANSSVLWWKLLEQTSNDAIGMMLAIWAVALVMLCVDAARWQGRAKGRFALCALAGGLAGLAFVVKMTQFIGVLAAFCILLFLEGRWSERVKYILCFGLAALLISVAVGWSWAMDSWRACGSPIYPFMLDYFSAHVPGTGAP